MSHIPNQELTPEMLPKPEADWSAIGNFALTFNGYEYWGSFEACGDKANAAKEVYKQTGELPQSLTLLRTCLFFEQRRWRHYGYEPDEPAMAYIRSLVSEISGYVSK